MPTIIGYRCALIVSALFLMLYMQFHLILESTDSLLFFGARLRPATTLPDDIETNGNISHPNLATDVEQTIRDLLRTVELQRQQMDHFQDRVIEEALEARKALSAEIESMRKELSTMDQRFQQSQTVTALTVLNQRLQEVQQKQDKFDGPHSASFDQIKRDVEQLHHDWRKSFPLDAVSHERKDIPQIFKDDNGTGYLNPLYENNDTFCLSWKVNSDKWWTHHVDWMIKNETDDGYCFSPIENVKDALLLRRLYNIQFRGYCDQARTKRIWNCGFGGEFANVLDGLLKALGTNQPTTMIFQDPWVYAVNKDGSLPACTRKDFSCYFLPFTRCEPDPAKAWPGSFYSVHQPTFLSEENRLLLWFATRPQTWLRKQVYEFSKTIPLTQPCSVIHVRRTDVWTEKRRYFAIEDYVNATDKLTKTIFLLTDDDNAIKEARAKYPDRNWVVIDRPRLKGNEAGWGAHFPSGDPRREIIVLLSIFREVRKCSVFVHGFSNLSEYIAAWMISERGDELVRFDLHKDGKHQVWNNDHINTVNLSRSDWRR